MALQGVYACRGKRLFDLALVVLALVVLAPLLALLAILVRLKLGSPVLFRQRRPGLHGHPFTIYKFRTMTDERDAQGCLLPDASRLTSLGRFLRKTSLDELPELYNVLRGEMSLVGPRPLLMEYLDRYTEEQNVRHQVVPGITGWSQINGRQGIPFSKRLELDAWYAQHQSFGLDLKILLLTIPRVLQARGVILGQDVKEVDDLNLSSALDASTASEGE
jgi:sugar transferase EpsL